ncbi:type VI secretion system tip protein VgrG, partial [Serratia fonticola]
EELYVNELGWVRVHFHWNRYDPADEKASCWVPVSNQWAGDGFGSVTLPRIGQEVLISYLNGDIDRPVVSGRYYNGLNKPPYPLPANKTKSVWRTKSHKAEGFNELSFED